MTEEQWKIREGRLLRKIERLLGQREYLKKQLHHYEKVISMQPYIEQRYITYTERVAERERIKGLEQRVKEQAKLIELLQKQIADPVKKCTTCGTKLMSDMTNTCFGCNQLRQMRGIE